jgi:hypothetical protein
MKKKNIPDREPNVGNDPMELSQEGVNKRIIAPDPDKVRQAEERKRNQRRERPDPRRS